MSIEKLLSPQEASDILIQTTNFSQGSFDLQFRFIRGITLYEPSWKMLDSDLSGIYQVTYLSAHEIVFRGRNFPNDPSYKHHPLTSEGKPITEEQVRNNVQHQVDLMRIFFKPQLNPAEVKYLDEQGMTGIRFSQKPELLKEIEQEMLYREQYFAGKRGGREFFRPYVLEGKQTQLPVLNRVFADVKAQYKPTE